VHSLPLLPGSSDGVWIRHCVKDSYDYYYNLDSGEGTWLEPEGFQQRDGQLSKEEIQVLGSGLYLLNNTMGTLKGLVPINFIHNAFSICFIYIIWLNVL
jgi:hypothetical protein